MTHQRALEVVKAYVNRECEGYYQNVPYRLKTPWHFGPSTLEVVEYEGGDEGDGEYMHIVFKVTEEREEQYVKITGRHDSYSDDEWYEDEMKIVFPRQVMVTVYE